MLVLLIACTETAGTGGLEAPVIPSAWTYDAPDRELKPALELAEISEALAEAVAMLLWIDPRKPYDAYVDARTRFDATCPERSEHNRQDLDLGDCADADGTAFFGYEVSVDMHNAPVDYEGISAWHHNFRFMSGNSHVTDANGFELEAAGSALFRDYENDDGSRASRSMIWGDYSRVGDPQDDWLDDALGVEVYIDSLRTEAAKSMAIEGGVTRASGIARAFTFDGLVIDESVCALEPAGSISVWGQDSRWIGTFFDDLCDGCGAAFRGGDALGEVCADFTPLLGWSNTPWD